MVTDQPSPGAQEVLAANLRRLRIARSLSLSELARATGLSKATLSGVEGGKCNPTVGTIERLAGALRVSLGELLEAPPLERIRVVRATAAEPDPLAAVRSRELDALSPFETATLTEIALRPRHIYEPEPHADGSRGHVYVLQGRLITGPTERITELAAGDYAAFPVDVPYVFEARQHPVRLLVLTQTPG